MYKIDAREANAAARKLFQRQGGTFLFFTYHIACEKYGIPYIGAERDLLSASTFLRGTLEHVRL